MVVCGHGEIMHMENSEIILLFRIHLQRILILAQHGIEFILDIILVV